MAKPTLVRRITSAACGGKNSTSLRCNQCNGWSHLKTCSGFKPHREWTTGNVDQCRQRPNAPQHDTNHIGHYSSNTLRIRKLPNTSAVLDFSREEIFWFIGKSKAYKSISPDGISMLKHLGPAGAEFLTKVLNLLWLWLFKPGKPANKRESYRPITVLSTVAKAIEDLLLPTFTHHLRPAAHQHGFRKVHSTITVINLINTQIFNGLNQNRPCARAILVALDLSKAFDKVNGSVLLTDIEKFSLLPYLQRWVMGYLSGRQSSVIFRGETSKPRKIKQVMYDNGVWPGY
ncbi:unnamed protein product [Ceratitis capitata]|uniref:(Mediterranean fruit fly) hypothetical protein n=1 Tax=Ceratitis capitata TaxID=7213 RepID=A0A811USK3_CERCA|nr:unnamed protein product [Ceratitis capitata]